MCRSLPSLRPAAFPPSSPPPISVSFVRCFIGTTQPSDSSSVPRQLRLLDFLSRPGIDKRLRAKRGLPGSDAISSYAEASKGVTVLCILPDTGERYLSTPLFGDIPADVTDEEIAISRSTPPDERLNERQSQNADVRSGSGTDILRTYTDVRFTSQSGHCFDGIEMSASCRKRTIPIDGIPNCACHWPIDHRR
jgi:hypothetical protein